MSLWDIVRNQTINATTFKLGEDTLPFISIISKNGMYLTIDGSGLVELSEGSFQNLLKFFIEDEDLVSLYFSKNKVVGDDIDIPSVEKKISKFYNRDYFTGLEKMTWEDAANNIIKLAIELLTF